MKSEIENPKSEIFCPNLLIISGTSAKSGKTTMACRIIEHFRKLQPVVIKVSPHFHTSSPGLITIEEGPGYYVYEETTSGTDKDTSRMLKAGAAKVFLVLVWENDVETIFRKVIDRIPADQPVICESPTIRKFFEPGMFIIMDSDNTDKRQDVNELRKLPHLEINLNEIAEEDIPVSFSDGKWHYFLLHREKPENNRDHRV